jgi:Spy/CpxP family protein refolding chaperone
MKKFLLFAVCLAFAAVSMAQSSNDEVAMFQSMYGMGKQQLIADHMKFTEAESAKFWKIYDEYEISRKEIGKTRIANIKDYAENYEKLSNEKATQLVKSSLANSAAFNKLQDKTFKKISKELSPIRAAQFFQIETFLESIVRARIAGEIPLIESIEPKK